MQLIIKQLLKLYLIFAFDFLIIKKKNKIIILNQF